MRFYTKLKRVPKSHFDWIRSSFFSRFGARYEKDIHCAGDLAIPARGCAFLWVLAILLILISGYELYAHLEDAQR
jgi:hypothetical protein